MMRFRQTDNERSSLFTRRALLLGGTQAVLLSALAGRLYQLQVLDTQRFATMAEDNRINVRLLAPARGLIFDRTGQPLAVNRNNYRAMVSSDRGRGAEVLIDRLDQIFALSDADKVRLLRELRRSRNAQPSVVRENLNWEEVARLEFNAPDLPGVFIDLGQSRDYPEGELMSHIIGYTGRVADEDLNGRDDPVLQLATMRFGKKGVERSLEDDLRGRAGAVQVEVNAVGRVVRELDRTEGQPGANALLTIDLELQKFANEKLKEQQAGSEHQSGAVVVMDVITGDVIVMVSQPGFDPNMFARGITQTEWRDLLDNPERPLNNKAIGGVYPPGSTYKVVTALAALDSKAIDPWTVLPCNGFIELGDIKFHCWLKGGHGGLNVQGAITASCDCFFYEAARRAGVDRIAEMGGRLGLGKLTELGLPGESPGTQPSRQWKQEKYSKPWQQGDTFNLGIGQGYMTATPLQLAVMAARVANGGYEVQPNILLAKALPREELAPPQVRTKVAAPSLRLDPKHLAIIHQGMSDVVNSGAGTANALRFDSKTGKPLEPALQFAGKTGTAQVKRITERERDMGITQEQLPWHLRHHGLFICFGPVENPRYACAVIVEHGQAGFNAGKVGKEVLVETMRRDPSRHMERYKKVAAS